jgi:deoxyadenosine/deoxycytidine kinase
LLLYLAVTPETALRRIKVRARPSEELITLDYLTTLRDAYRRLLTEIESGQHAWSIGMKIVRIDWNEDNQPIEPIVAAIKNALPLSFQGTGKATTAPSITLSAW